MTTTPAAAPSAANTQPAPATPPVPVTPEAIAEALAALDNGEALAAEFSKMAADAAKAKGEAAKLSRALAKANGTGAGLAAERDAISAKFNKLADFAGIDAAADFDSELERVAKGRKGGDPALMQSRINELTRANGALEKQKAEADKLAADRLGRINDMIRDRAVRRALKTSGALEPDALVPLFSAAVKVGDDGAPVYVMDDGAEVTVEEGVKSFFERHQALLANSQKAGAGSLGGVPGRPDFARMTQAEYEKARRDGRL